MSCRVLGRKVEVAALQELVVQARARGVRRLLGEYLPTEKNQLVAEHYEKLGFTQLERRDDGSSLWALEVREAPLVALPITVQRFDLELKEAAAE